MRILLNFARLPDPAAARLAAALRARDLEVVGIASHGGEDPSRFGGPIVTARWHDYSPSVAEVPWRGPRLEDVLDGPSTISLLPMVERPAPRLGGASEAMWRLRSDLARAADFLDRTRPDAVISLDFPESGLDLFVHLLSARERIPGLWLRRGLTAFSRVATTDPFEPVLDEGGEPNPSTIDLGGRSSPESRERVARSLAAMSAGIDPDVIPHVRREWVRETPVRGLVRRVARRSSRYNRLQRSRPVLGGRVFLEHLRRDLDRHAAAPDWTGGSPICVLALHYQPELSTLTLGSWAVRQLEVAKMLADHLPSDWRLFVKEHPSTFSVNFSKTTVTFRPPAFYERLASMPRTTLLPLEVDVRARWRRISLAATVTGTFGSEALAVGCPVLHFGLAPYTNFVGALKVDTPDPLQLRRAVDAAARFDRAAIAAGFLERSRRVEALSYQSASTSLQDRMVDAMSAALELWRPPDVRGRGYDPQDDPPGTGRS